MLRRVMLVISGSKVELAPAKYLQEAVNTGTHNKESNKLQGTQAINKFIHDIQEDSKAITKDQRGYRWTALSLINQNII